MAPSDVSSAMVAGQVDVEQSRLSTLGGQARTILDFFDGHECEFLSSMGNSYRYLATQAIARLDPAPERRAHREPRRRGPHWNWHVDRDGDAGRPVRGNQRRPGNVPRA